MAVEKSDTIRDLQERLDLSQKKLANYMAQTSSKGYSNVKAMHDRYEIDKEKFAQDLCTYQVSDKYELIALISLESIIFFSKQLSYRGSFFQKIFN